MAFKKTYRYFTLQRQKSGIQRRMKTYKNKIKPLALQLKKEQVKLLNVNKEIKKL